ncbi:MAG TPA: ATP-grasp domain-containing protein, partial [Candidatus Sulfotelmatobacter sp.]|nr:ATP-grasp domain-containing protein [Candidatus Sulfotelmatobacter sp.]
RLITSLSEIGSAAPFPLVLKPVHSKLMVAGELRTLAVAVISDEAQRQEQLRRWLSLTPVLQQQYVGGRGVGIEFLFNHGQKVWHFVHERLHEYPLSGGASSYRRAIQPPPELLHDAERLLNALNWHGVAMVEFKMDGRGQYWLMEINPRLWGSLAVSIDAGVDFPRGLLKVARGEHPSAQPDYRLVYTRDFRTDLEWLKANLTADPQDRLLLTRSRTLSFVELLRPLTGREKWDHFDWRDLGVTRRLLAAAFTDQARPVFRRIRDWRVRRRWLRHHRAVLSQLAHSSGVKKIVFLCYGNICRSPLAAGLAQQSLPQVEIVSAGFHPQSERNCPEKMLRIAQSFNLDLSHHRSARITREQLLTADLVVAMDLENIRRLKAEFPEALSRTTLLGLFSHPARVAIADPYNADESTTGKICDRVRSGIEGLVQSIPASQAVLSSAELPPAVQSAR